MTCQAHVIRPAGVVRRVLGSTVHPFFVAGQAIGVPFFGMWNLRGPPLSRGICLHDEIGYK